MYWTFLVWTWRSTFALMGREAAYDYGSITAIARGGYPQKYAAKIASGRPLTLEWDEIIFINRNVLVDDDHRPVPPFRTGTQNTDLTEWQAKFDTRKRVIT